MIKSLSTGESGSKACFKLLKQATGNLSWERIFDSLRQYCDGLLAEMGSNSSITGRLEISFCGFSTISRVLERILMEHIEIKDSSDSKL